MTLEVAPKPEQSDQRLTSAEVASHVVMDFNLSRNVSLIAYERFVVGAKAYAFTSKIVLCPDYELKYS
jgi:hypothetical protein